MIGMKKMFEIIGIYKVSSDEPCWLVECFVISNGNVFDIGEVTQEDNSLSELNWQVPYLEKVLNNDGTEIIADDIEFTDVKLWESDPTRICFFFHYLDFSKPLKTPYGMIDLPKEKAKPDRLIEIKYE